MLALGLAAGSGVVFAGPLEAAKAAF